MPQSRDAIWSQYLDQLEFEPYPVQEDALLQWFSSEQGVLVCAPTGMGKTVIAEAALFEALHTGKTAYYTTPLIALTEQKFREMQQAAVRWGFSADEIGLVTGNRRVNPEARILVVVAEILVNRLLHPTAFDFENVCAVVMDEFHSFNDPERGIVWELSLALLPKHVRLLLLSATVGNAAEFTSWLNRNHGRKVQLVQSGERRVPLRYHWVDDRLLNEHLETMAEGDEETRKTPALVFCFNREACWSVAEQLKGCHLIDKARQKQLAAELSEHNWSRGAGPKLKPILLRGVGVHHAGVLPRYRRIVEDLFQRKLLSVTVCTETLAAGINLPARSVVLTSLLKGPPGKKTLINASSAHQMFGRAGRPQYDSEGYVYALAHEDDVKIARWKEKYDQIPEDTKDPNLIKAKKKLKKKMPTRRKTEQYWNEAQFEKLKAAPPTKLASRGPLPWRLLAYLLTLSPDVEKIRAFLNKRFMDARGLQKSHRALNRMLLSLWAGGYIRLEPEPPIPQETASEVGQAETEDDHTETASQGTLGALIDEARSSETVVSSAAGTSAPENNNGPQGGSAEEYHPRMAHATPALEPLLVFRSVHPLYGAFLSRHLGLADEGERIQALESVLEFPGSAARLVRVPPPEELPPGWLATNYLDPELLSRGLATEEELYPQNDDRFDPQRKFPVPLANKLRLLFQSEFPDVKDLKVQPVWAAGDLLQFGGRFDNYVKARQLAKQEGLIFRHVLRLILLCQEFAEVCPPETDPQEWREVMRNLTEQLTASCRDIDPESTDKAIQAAHAADVVEGESEQTNQQAPKSGVAEDWAAGLFEE